MRIAVIGAGIVGVHIAVALARSGAEVTMLDRGEPGGGTTAGSFAWIDASHPGIAPYLELRVLGVDAWHRIDEEYGRPRWLSLTGTLIWTRAPEEAEKLERHFRRLEAHGGSPRRLSVREALGREPDLRLPSDVEAVYGLDGEGWVQTGPAIAALLQRGHADGLRLRAATEVRELSVASSGRLVGLVLASGERVRTDAVVSCVGRFTDSLLGPAGIHVPMLKTGAAEVPVAGLVARTSSTPCRIGSVLLADGMLIRSDNGGRLLVHSDACDARLTGQTPGPGAGEQLLELLARRLRGAEQTKVEYTRVCVRAIPRDLVPVAGWALDGLYVVATHSGVTLAPGLADLVAAEVLDGANREELARFRPGRFGKVMV